MIPVRVCCYCRRQMQGADSRPFGPTRAPSENETTGICGICFEREFGKLDVNTEPTGDNETEEIFACSI